MAELEIINHMKKSLAAFSHKEKSLKEKLKAFFLEIFIIVFAVSLSIWLHAMSEHHHQQQEVNFFLKELYKDLAYDLKVYEKAKLDCEQTARGYAYFSTLPFGSSANSDSVRYYQPYLFLKYTPLPTQGRYESFKNSGKINNIRNATLEGDILDLFEEDVKNLSLETTAYKRLQDNFADYLALHVRRTRTNTNSLQVFASDESVNYSRQLLDTRPIDTAYSRCIAKIKTINSQIVHDIGKVAE